VRVRVPPSAPQQNQRLVPNLVANSVLRGWCHWCNTPPSVLNSPIATTVTVDVVLVCSYVKRASQPTSYVFRPAVLFVVGAENDEVWGAGLGFSFFGLRFSRLPLCSLLAIGCLRSLPKIAARGSDRACLNEKIYLKRPVAAWSGAPATR
jgi:hypothetical protein